MKVVGTVVTSEFDRSCFEVIYHTDLFATRCDYVHVITDVLHLSILRACHALLRGTLRLGSRRTLRLGSDTRTFA